ncbi:acyltransferase family protein [Streptomyces indicus]|uniref:Peptidoglycan/LPS O-acetylase OafA/YrhL, contains acyltransferase and SGNH-hydrolase domains n=1 Tax=Streptomyces indicus TaxID=417292 RepID=A0A1G9EK72_9ACTN|nr:acyltransferase [Streptomyces indicus]SDK76425.1 Peptidoglycan/LPS O-acetylase OafA/YrhL, contains acyltransferase and SGNH-hydrolase domains [Streptomyces indicus]
MTSLAVRPAPPETDPQAVEGARPARPARRGARLRALDGLRLLAALMVAAYHYGGRGGEITDAWGSSAKVQFPTAHEWFALGCLGVQIFFVISGFVICMSGWGRTLRSFFASRASRLLPSYWAAVVLVTAVFALPPVVYKAVSPSDFLVNLSMLQMPLGADRVLGVCWTLWAEIRFYALFALCIVLPGATRQRVVLFCAVWTLAAAIADAADSALLDLVLMPEYAPFFIGGMGLYLVYRDRRDLTAWGIVAVSWLTGQHYAVRELYQAPSDEIFAYRPSLAIIGVVTLGFAAVAAIALGWLGRVDWRWLTTAGALTYPFYLVHEHLGWVAVRFLHRGFGVPSWATFALTVGGMLVLAWLLYRFVERWATPLLREKLGRPFSPSARG